MDLVLGLIVGAVLTGGLCYGRGRWLRIRQTRALINDLVGLEVPLVAVEFPSRRAHFSGPVRASLASKFKSGDSIDRVIEGMVHEKDRPNLRGIVKSIRDGVHGMRQATFLVRYGPDEWHEVQAHVFRMGSGLLGAMLEDRTASLTVIEERDRLFNLSIDLLAVGDMTGRLQQVNPAWVRVLHWSRDDIMDRTFTDLIHPEDRPQARRAQEELRKGVTVGELALRTLCRDGSHRWISWSSFPLIERQTVFTVARDITDQKNAELELQRYQARLKQLASQLSVVEEREMRRLAEILHDTLAQDLFAAQAKLSVLKYRDRIEDPDRVRDEIEEILKHATELTRTLTFELFPPALYEVGLDAALEWLCRSFRKTRGLECVFLCGDDALELEIDQRTLLYQGARELLGNVYKHAGAQRAEVRLDHEPSTVCLQVDDDGCGFDFESYEPDDGDGAAPAGFGLFNIGERLGQNGGRLSIETSHLGGGRVVLNLPLSPGQSGSVEHG